MKHRHVAANGVTLHAIELGDGPVVLFVHGFPDTWRGWRRQMEAVAEKGYRAVALDMRGYGESSAPADAALYTPFHTVGDLVGLLDALQVETATVIGHDFGASVAWNAAMMRPDRFTAVFGMSVPFLPPGGKSFLQQLRETGKNEFYMFHQMRPEADSEWADAATVIPGMLYWTSGSAPDDQRWDPFDPARGLTRPSPVGIPSWADADDVAAAIAEFQRTGFHGPLNYYRAIQPFADMAGAVCWCHDSAAIVFSHGQGRRDRETARRHGGWPAPILAGPSWFRRPRRSRSLAATRSHEHGEQSAPGFPRRACRRQCAASNRAPISRPITRVSHVIGLFVSSQLAGL